jgi:hypothetical protein
LSEQYTDTPVAGSAIAETSASSRIEHDESLASHAGFATVLLHPLPAPDQAASAQPRVEAERVSDVPPTATTPLYVAGGHAPPANPLSPLDAVIKTPACA